MAEQRPKNPRVTVITPVFNEQQGLSAYRQAVTDTLLSCPDFDFEILFVDDGSTDDSWRMIQKICADSSRFSALRLSRNFGAHSALTAGIDYADSDAVATLACDLQDPPDTILAFVDKWRQGAQIVWGRRRSRAEQNWRVWTSSMFFRLIRRHAMPKGSRFSTGSFFLIDRRVANAFRRFRERRRQDPALPTGSTPREPARHKM